MRIVHFSTFDYSGGAARSAYRLHKGLQEIGVSSTMVVRDKKSDDETVYPVKATPSFWARKSRELVEKWYVRKNRAAISNTYFSLFRSSIELLWPSKVHEADVLHFHWVTEFLELEPMEQVLRLGKPVVWTLHDQRPFTGGCHFTAG